MPNVILPNLGIELPDVGSDQDTWGDILNADLQILDKAVQYDVISKTLAGVDVTLTDVEAASAVINLTGTLTANVNVIVPATPVRVYLVRNQTSGAFTVTIKTAAGTGTPVQQGTSSLVYSDGTNIIQGATSVNGSFAVSGALTAGSLNNTPVGNTTPSSGAFTTLSASGATTLNGAVTLGGAAGDAITVTGTASFAQATQFPDGTAALPSITNTGDTNTGVYFPAADTVGISTAGSERARVDSLGRLLVGVTAARVVSAVIPAVQIVGASADTSGLLLARTSADVNAGTFRFAKDRAGAVVQSGDTLGAVSFNGFDGTNYIQGAQISSQVDGTPGSNDMPGRLLFSTTPDGATAPVERLRIDSAGRVAIAITPSPWSVLNSLDLSSTGAIAASGTSLQANQNNYFDGTNYIYKTTSLASRVVQSGGGFQWFTAPSGTAGNPITFTQALTLFQAGQLLLGATSLSAGAFAEFTSTTGALIVPRMTTAQRDAMGAVANGAIIYNTTTNKMNFRENAAWVQPTVTAA